MHAKTKADLLAHYANRHPRQFAQIDGFAHGDELMGRDADGQAIIPDLQCSSRLNVGLRTASRPSFGSPGARAIDPVPTFRQDLRAIGVSHGTDRSPGSLLD